MQLDTNEHSKSSKATTKMQSKRGHESEMGELNIFSFSHSNVNMNASIGASVSAGSYQHTENTSEEDQADTTFQHMILTELQHVNTRVVASSSSKHSPDPDRDSKLSSSSGCCKNVLSNIVNCQLSVLTPLLTSQTFEI